MSIVRWIGRRIPFCLPICWILVAAIVAGAAVKSGTIHITVIDSETHTVKLDDSNGVPKNCDPLNYDAYCHSGKTEEIVYTLLVKSGNEAPFRVSCAIETKWSSCVSLPAGGKYDAKKEKRGLTIYFVDDRGKPRKQLYTYVPNIGEPTPVKVEESDETAGSAAGGSTAKAEDAPALVKCSVTSNPSGAEIAIDGRYVGSTPSDLSLTVGKHDVVISLSGFAQWKRELVVSQESQLTIHAVLEKTP